MFVANVSLWSALDQKGGREKMKKRDTPIPAKSLLRNRKEKEEWRRKEENPFAIFSLHAALNAIWQKKGAEWNNFLF